MVDVPLSEKIEDFSGHDTLGTKKYADSLAKFVRQCDTPLTVGVQGEWGSGKTSILNIIRSLIHHSNEDVRVSRQKTESVKGAEVFKTIWIDTWEHSLLKNPEECLLSIVEEIIDEITKIDGKFKTAQKAKSAIATLAKGAIRIGTSAALGTHAGSVADDLLSNDTSNGIRALRNALDKAVKDIVETEENHINRFIIFVDDLDRLEPSIAIKVLELLKNIFNIQHCVFILAIDYQVVVKGLKDKFGEPNEKNEWEFRAFFDKIIQLPFMMPTAQYNLGDYIYNMLVKEVEYFEKSETKMVNQPVLENIVRSSIGRNPRSLKRLVNSVSLIKMQNLDELSELKKNAYILKELVFALVCLQISFPKVYELLITESDFGTWDEAFSRRFINSSKLFAETEKALLELKKSFPDDFDDEWEMALFRIVWAKNWQRDRVVEISRLLSIILDGGIFKPDHDEDFITKRMAEAVKMTAVTSVSATDDILAGQNDDKHDEAEKNRGRANYWAKLLKSAKGSKCTFDSEINKFPDRYFASNLTRPISFSSELSITATTGSTTPFKIGQQHKCSDEAFENVFEKLKANQAEIEKITHTTEIKINGEGNRQNMAFGPPKGVKKYVTLHNDATAADKIQKWMIEVLPKLEEFLQSKLDHEDNP